MSCAVKRVRRARLRSVDQRASEPAGRAASAVAGPRRPALVGHPALQPIEQREDRGIGLGPRRSASPGRQNRASAASSSDGGGDCRGQLEDLEPLAFVEDRRARCGAAGRAEPVRASGTAGRLGIEGRERLVEISRQRLLGEGRRARACCRAFVMLRCFGHRLEAEIGASR